MKVKDIVYISLSQLLLYVKGTLSQSVVLGFVFISYQRTSTCYLFD